jgi:hypothetical protein
VDLDRHPAFIIGLVTRTEQLWRNILNSSDQNFWINDEGIGIALFEPNADCGATTIYKWDPIQSQLHQSGGPQPSNFRWQNYESGIQLMRMLLNSDRPNKYISWLSKTQKILSLPMQLAEGRLTNTTVEKAVIYSRGDGCVFCGMTASAYAATTICGGKLFLQLQVCEDHLKQANAAPTVLSVLAEVLHAQIDLPHLQKFDHIPDEYVGSIIKYLADGLMSSASVPEKRKNGWHSTLTRPSGWSWVVRLHALNDYAYMLFDKNEKQRHRIDSAPHHPEIPFGPSHQHFYPGTKREISSPSFTYGVPLFDVISLNDIVTQYERENS